MPIPDERLRAKILVLEHMVEALWIHVLGSRNEPTEEADAEQEGTLARLSAETAIFRGRDIAFDELEGMWALIQTALRELQEPIGYDLAARHPPSRPRGAVRKRPHWSEKFARRQA